MGVFSPMRARFDTCAGASGSGRVPGPEDVHPEPSKTPVQFQGRNWAKGRAARFGPYTTAIASYRSHPRNPSPTLRIKCGVPGIAR